MVIQTAFLGDLLLTIPLLRNLRRLWPESEITLLARWGLGALLKDLGLVDSLESVKKKDQDSYREFSRKYSSTVFDLIFCPHSSLRTTFFLNQLHAKRKICFSAPSLFLFKDIQKVKKNKKLPESLRNLQLLSSFDSDLNLFLSDASRNWAQPEPQFGLGLKTISPFSFFQGLSPQHLEIVSMNLRKEIQDRFGPSKKSFKSPYIVFFPGSSWATKEWGIAQFVKLAKAYQKKDTMILLLGSEDDFTDAQEIETQVKAEGSGPGIENLCGKLPLQETLQILLRSQLVVTNDNGGQHLASLVGVPTFSVFGPTLTDFGFAAWNPLSVAIENQKLPCRPCSKHGSKLCPLGTHECMKTLKPELVEQIIEQTRF